MHKIVEKRDVTMTRTEHKMINRSVSAAMPGVSRWPEGRKNKVRTRARNVEWRKGTMTFGRAAIVRVPRKPRLKRKFADFTAKQYHLRG